MNKLEITLQDLSDYMADKIKRSTSDQGHNLTGSLARSTIAKTSKLNDSYYGDVIRNAYGEVMENGVNRNRVPFSRGSGAKTSQYIQGLLEFVKKRNLKPKAGGTQLGIAFAIAQAQKNTGMPTVRSRRFSKTGRRTGAVAEASKKNKTYITQEIKKGALANLEEFAFDLVSEAIDSPFVTISIE